MSGPKEMQTLLFVPVGKLRKPVISYQKSGNFRLGNYRHTVLYGIFHSKFPRGNFGSDLLTVRCRAKTLLPHHHYRTPKIPRDQPIQNG